MVKSLGQVMLYVRNQDENAKFWKEKAGFEKVEKLEMPDGSYVYMVAPLLNSEVEMVLQDKNKMEKLAPELNLGTPSIMMVTDDLEKVHKHFIDNGINANPLMEYSGTRFFNFSDNEENYFAIREVK